MQTFLIPSQFNGSRGCVIGTVISKLMDGLLDGCDDDDDDVGVNNESKPFLKFCFFENVKNYKTRLISVVS